MDWYLGVWKKFAVFSGRARRTEYWMFVLVNSLVCIAVGLISGSLLGDPLLSELYSLAVFLPGLAVAIRRLHDSGRSGWWFLILVVPLIGWIAYLVFMCLDSQPGENKYGPNPKEKPAPAAN